MLYLPFAPDVNNELYLASKITAFIKDRLKNEGHLPEYLEIECNNLEFSLQHELDAKRRLMDPDYTINELLKFYELAESSPKLKEEL